jgi:hypothetical protein
MLKKVAAGSAGHQGDNWWVEYDLPGGGCRCTSSRSKERRSTAVAVPERSQASPH